MTGGSCVYSNVALAGNPREITITNTSTTDTTTPLTVTPTSFPSGTTITTDNCTGATLAPLSTCAIIITPGQVATDDCTSGIAPTSGTVTVNASSAPSAVTSDVVVLSYGCIYQGGFVYSIDDTTGNTGSIGGKVASLVDQAEPYTTGAQASSIIWTSNGAGSVAADVSFDKIPLIGEINNAPTYADFSTYFQSVYFNPVAPAPSAFASCNGAYDGLCNTSNISAFYDYWQTNYAVACDPNQGGGGCTATQPNLNPPQTSYDFYAAGKCRGPINTYSSWYLPAICEMNAIDVGVTCPSGTQSMAANLSFLIGDPGAPTPSTSCSYGVNCLAGYYWSSTEYSGVAEGAAWYGYFSAGASAQGSIAKDFQMGVRCSRALVF